VRLSLLDYPTGVGLRYGLARLSEATVFLEAERDRLDLLAEAFWDPCSALLGDLPPRISASHVPRAVNAHALIFPLRHAAPRRQFAFPGDMLCTTLDSKKSPKWYRVEATQALEQPPLTILARYRNIDLSSIGYAFQPDLRNRLTPRRSPLRGKPWGFGGQGFHLPCRYSCQQSHFPALHPPSQESFTAAGNAPLPRHVVMRSMYYVALTASVHRLAPIHFRRIDTSTSELLRFL